MTPEQMLEAWRAFIAAGVHVQMESGTDLSETVFCRIDVVDNYHYLKSYTAHDADPLQAFVLAYEAYRKAQGI